MKTSDIDFSPQFTRTLELLENGSGSIFVTGHAGTGKSTLLEHFRNTTDQNIAVLAPTGVAALNVKGQTIHSFFGFRPGTTPQDIKKFYRNKGKKGLYKSLDAIVIDEISMVRADLLDCVDEFLSLHGPDRSKPFGGIRMIFIGDLYQLPPVVTSYERDLFQSYYQSPYFFDAKVMQELDLTLIELDKIYRQEDQSFIEILHAIRSNQLSSQQLERLNKRHERNFSFDPEDMFIYLSTTNKKADQVNRKFLNELDNESHIYKARKSGKFDKKIAPTGLELELKVGAQVMMINNDKAGRWVNGSIGKIVEIVGLGGAASRKTVPNEISEDDVMESLGMSKSAQLGGSTKVGKKGSMRDVIVVELADGSTVDVEPFTWEMFKFLYNPASNQLQAESVGSFTQYPLILAWAITIHKSQGKTFDKAVIDFGWGTFAHGQAYVALSRCRSLEGMVLNRPFEKKHIITDRRIGEFFKHYEFSKKPWELSENDKMRVLQKALDSGSLVKIKYVVEIDQDKNELKEYMLSVKSLEDVNIVGGFCYLAQQEVVLNLERIVELEVVEGIA